MSTHLTNKEIDNYVSGLASAEDVKMTEEHLTSCRQCSMIVKSLSSLLREQKSDAVPGEHVRDAVFAEWHRLHNEIAESNIKSIKSRPRIKTIMTGLAAAATVVIAVSSYVFLNLIKVDPDYTLAITSVSGEVYINDLLTSANNTLKTGDVLRTGVKSSVVVASEGYILYAGRSASLIIAGNNKKDGIGFELNEGPVISKSSGSIRYSFVCGEYKVVPAGTEFMLKFSEGRLEVAVSQGKVIVTGVNLRIEISAGMKWSSGNQGRIDILDPETSALINTVNTGIWPVEKKSAGEQAEKTVGIETPAAVIKGDKIKNNPVDDKKEKMEKLKLNREIRDEMNEMNEMKKEQRRERKGRNKI